MNVAVNFLREHVIPEARMHYAITNSGGFSPNVVQAEAEVLYLLPGPKDPPKWQRFTTGSTTSPKALL